MLDFYYLRDNELDPEYPDESRYIGGLSMTEFKLLSEVIKFSEKNGIYFKFFSDFRLKEDDLKLLASFVKDFLEQSKVITKEKEEAYKKFRLFISIANSKSSEIFCFSD